MIPDTIQLLSDLASAESERVFVKAAFRFLYLLMGAGILVAAVRGRIREFRNPLIVASALLMIAEGMNALFAVLALSSVGAKVTGDRLGALMGPGVPGTLFVVGYLLSRASDLPPSNATAVVAEHAVLVSRARGRVLMAVLVLSLVGATPFAVS